MKNFWLCSPAVVVAVFALSMAQAAASAFKLTTSVDQYTFENEVVQAGRPVIMLSCPVIARCDADEAVVAAQAAAHPEFKFVKAYSERTEVPALRIFVPHCGFTFRSYPFDASKVSGDFWAQRYAYVEQEVGAWATFYKASRVDPSKAIKAWNHLQDVIAHDR